MDTFCINLGTLLDDDERNALVSFCNFQVSYSGRDIAILTYFYTIVAK